MTNSERPKLHPAPAAPLTGAERFDGLDATVADFWSWAFSDLRENTTRGILAEYLVAKAVGDDRASRMGWDNFDVLAEDGTRIEVKCSAYLQSWVQKRVSKLSFGRLTGAEWDHATNTYAVDRTVRADIYVFAVQTQQDPSAYDMLGLGHWEFWVVPGDVVAKSAGRTVGIGWVRTHGAGPVSHAELREAIRGSG